MFESADSLESRVGRSASSTTTCPEESARERFSSRRRAPPPREMTLASPATASINALVSMSRKTVSPCPVINSVIEVPLASICASRSRNGLSRACARAAPTVDFPLPGIP